MGQLKNRIALLRVQKKVVGLQMEVRYAQQLNHILEINNLLTSMTLEDINMLGLSQYWMDWEKLYHHLHANDFSCPMVTIQQPLPNLYMKIVLWNIRGASRNEFIPYAWDIIKQHHPLVFVLLETKCGEDRARQVQLQLGFIEFKVINPLGKRGGIWLFWKTGIDLVLFNAGNPNYFHALFHFASVDREFLVSGVHAPSTSRERKKFWNSMQEDIPPSTSPWLLMGYLNEVTSSIEKKGGRPFNPNQCLDLHNYMDMAGLVDLGFQGNPHTWTNARDGAALIKERLDRALANAKWLECFPKTKVLHLPRTYLDHAPILISLLIIALQIVCSFSM